MKTRMPGWVGSASRPSSLGSPQLSGQLRDPLFNGAAHKVIAVLETFGARRVLTLREVAVMVGIPEASAQRCLHTLEALGYVQRHSRDCNWVLAPRALQIPHAYLSGCRLIEESTRHLVDLNRASGESVALTEPDDIDMVLVEYIPSHRRPSIDAAVGERLPMYCAGAGRAYLSALPLEEVRNYVHCMALRALTSEPEIDPERVLMCVAEAGREGYAYSDEDYCRGCRAVAAPVIGEGNVPIGAVSMVVPTTRWSTNAIRKKLAPLVIETARAISSGSLLQSCG